MMLPRRLFGEIFTTAPRLFITWLVAVSASAALDFVRIAALFLVLSTSGFVVLPLKYSQMLPKFIETFSTPFRSLGLFALFSILFFLTGALATRLFANCIQGFVFAKRRALVEGYLGAPWAVTSNSQVSDLLSAITTESERLMRLSLAFLAFISNLITSLLLIILGCIASPGALKAIILCAPIVVIGLWLSRRGGAISRRVLASNISLAEQSNFILTQIKSIKAMNLERRFFDIFVKKIDHSRTENANNLFFTQLPTQIMDLVGAIFFSAILITGLRTGADISSLLLLLTVFVRIYPRINSTLTFYHGMVAHSSAIEFFDRVMAKLGSRAVPTESQDGELIFPSLRLDKACVRLNGQVILTNVNFSFKPGEKIAILGDSGSGKTTLIDAVLGLIPLHSGDIWMNGERATAEHFRKLRSSAAYIDQSSTLANLSLEENMKLYNSTFDPLAYEQMLKGVGLAGAAGKMQDRIVGPRGEGLSGGQRQRLCLIRSLLIPHSLVVLDEVTSSLDPESTAKVLDLVLCDKAVTVLFVTHDRSRVDRFDRVVEVLDGTLIERPVAPLAQLIFDSTPLGG